MSRHFAVAWLLILALVRPSPAAFHIAVIDEVMSGAAGDLHIQYVEIRMQAAGQNVIGNTRLTAFDCAGTAHELLLVPGPNLPNAGNGAHWLVASPDATTFLAAAGITPDRVWNDAATGGIPTACGQVCWGAPDMFPFPPDPGTWSVADPDAYVDCVAYGPYGGPQPTDADSPVPLSAGDGAFSLTRTGPTPFDNAFELASPTPTNNAGQTGSFGGAPGGTTSTTTTAPSTTSTTAAPALRRPLSGSRLVLTSTRRGARRALSVTSHDPGLVLGDGAGDDPTAGGATLRLRGAATGAEASYTLAAGGWRRTGGRGFRFRARRADPGPIRTVVVKNGRALRVKGAGAALPFALADDPTPVAMTLTVGTDRYCLAFGGTVAFVPGKRVVARNAPPPAACD
jgi:hypothetical protein